MMPRLKPTMAAWVRSLAPSLGRTFRTLSKRPRIGGNTERFMTSRTASNR